MTDALFIGWGDPIIGRETASLDVFREATEYYEGLRKKGEITGFEPVVLSHIGGPLRGFFLLRGDPAKLSAVAARDDFINLAMKASLVCENITIAPANAGASVSTILDTYRTAVNTLALQHQHI